MENKLPKDFTDLELAQTVSSEHNLLQKSNHEAQAHFNNIQLLEQEIASRQEKTTSKEKITSKK